ncbi:MAG TPA: hypothetical protein VNH18_23740 [Bryobacteraceae bacterium]|nr:hypothetical protein [Bryobacteraceae bacterium]
MYQIRKRTLIFPGAFLLYTTVAMAADYPPAQLFQLNGNANGPTAGYNGGTCTYRNPLTSATYTAPCDYWDLLNGAGTNNPDVPVTITQQPHAGDAAGNFGARSFVYGVGATPNFAGGGSKDPQDIPNWAWTSTSTPPKDALVAAYAAAYTAPDGTNDLVTIFGGERFSPNGDAFIGIWFFQQVVVPCPQPQGSPNASACTGVAAGKFSGAHTPGDLLVLSNFTNGGTAPGLAVYKWDPSCTSASKTQNAGDCAGTNLRIVANINSSALLCGSNPFCAVANTSPTDVQYPNGTTRTLQPPVFYEGGLDVTAALGSTPCFTSFLEETRSSQSVTAVLKDFLGGGFPVCGINMTKACPLCSIVAGSNPFQYTVQGTVTNTGLGTLYNATVSDQSLSFSCGMLNPGQTMYWGDWSNSPPAGTPVFCSGSGASGGLSDTFTSTSNPATNSASVDSTTSPSGGVHLTANVGPVTCQVCPVSPGLDVTKSCMTSLVTSNGGIGVRVDFTGIVTNTSSNVPLSGVQALEDDNNTLDNANNLVFGATALSLQPLDNSNNPVGPPCTSCTLQPGQSARYAGSYFPPGSDLSQATTTVNGHGVSGTTSQGRVLFYDSVKAQGTSTLPQNGVNPQANAGPREAHCPLCFLGACALQ